MILRRIADALKRQDWTVVFLEIAIVVVGIFIGLQVDDWNEARKHREQEATYLALLETDLEAMHAELVDRISGPGGTEQRLRTMILGLRGLEACEPSAEADVKYALERYQVSSPITYLSATYDEMVSTGALARIADVSLKRAIANSFSRLRSLGEVTDRVRISLPVVDEILWSRIDYGQPDERGRVHARFDFTQLCKDREVRNAFVEIIDLQADILVGQAQARQTIEDLLARLR